MAQLVIQTVHAVEERVIAWDLRASVRNWLCLIQALRADAVPITAPGHHGGVWDEIIETFKVLFQEMNRLESN